MGATMNKVAKAVGKGAAVVQNKAKKVINGEAGKAVAKGYQRAGKAVVNGATAMNSNAKKVVSAVKGMPKKGKVGLAVGAVAGAAGAAYAAKKMRDKKKAKA